MSRLDDLLEIMSNLQTLITIKFKNAGPLNPLFDGPIGPGPLPLENPLLLLGDIDNVVLFS